MSIWMVLRRCKSGWKARLFVCLQSNKPVKWDESTLSWESHCFCMNTLSTETADTATIIALKKWLLEPCSNSNVSFPGERPCKQTATLENTTVCDSHSEQSGPIKRVGQTKPFPVNHRESQSTLNIRHSRMQSHTHVCQLFAHVNKR